MKEKTGIQVVDRSGGHRQQLWLDFSAVANFVPGGLPAHFFVYNIFLAYDTGSRTKR